MAGLAQVFAFDNTERSLQSLGYQPPDQGCRDRVGGGEPIVERFGGDDSHHPRLRLSDDEFAYGLMQGI